MPNSIKYKPTYILIAINVAVYIYTSIVGGNWLNTNFNVIPSMVPMELRSLSRLPTTSFSHQCLSTPQ